MRVNLLAAAAAVVAMALYVMAMPTEELDRHASSGPVEPLTLTIVEVQPPVGARASERHEIPAGPARPVVGDAPVGSGDGRPTSQDRPVPFAARR